MRHRQRHGSPAEALLIETSAASLTAKVCAGMRALLDAARILDYAA